MKPAPHPAARVVKVLFITLAVVAGTVAAVRLVRPRESVAVLGDSLTAIAMPQIEAAGHAAGYTMHVDGIPGITLDARMDSVAQLAEHRSGPVVIELGTNDVLQHTSIEDLTARIDKAVTLLEHDPCVVWVTVGILYDDGRAHAFNDHLHWVAAAHPNVHLFDWEPVLHQHPDWSFDSVHLKAPYVPTYAQGIVDTIHDDC